MKKLVFVIVALLSTFALMACSPSAPESPDSEGYGTTIQPE